MFLEKQEMFAGNYAFGKIVQNALNHRGTIKIVTTNKRRNKLPMSLTAIPQNTFQKNYWQLKVIK